MKNVMKKISNIIKKIFGFGIMITLFAGGFTFFGYVAALIIGGDTATAICSFMYDKFIPVIIYITSVTVLLGLVAMYLGGEMALTAEGKKKKQ